MRDRDIAVAAVLIWLLWPKTTATGAIQSTYPVWTTPGQGTSIPATGPGQPGIYGGGGDPFEYPVVPVDPLILYGPTPIIYGGGEPIDSNDPCDPFSRAFNCYQCGIETNGYSPQSCQ